jgi:hypothetical protein
MSGPSPSNRAVNWILAFLVGSAGSAFFTDGVLHGAQPALYLLPVVLAGLAALILPGGPFARDGATVSILGRVVAYVLLLAYIMATVIGSRIWSIPILVFAAGCMAVATTLLLWPTLRPQLSIEDAAFGVAFLLGGVALGLTGASMLRETFTTLPQRDLGVRNLHVAQGTVVVALGVAIVLLGVAFLRDSPDFGAWAFAIGGLGLVELSASLIGLLIIGELGPPGLSRGWVMLATWFFVFLAIPSAVVLRCRSRWGGRAAVVILMVGGSIVTGPSAAALSSFASLACGWAFILLKRGILGQIHVGGTTFEMAGLALLTLALMSIIGGQIPLVASILGVALGIASLTASIGVLRKQPRMVGLSFLVAGLAMLGVSANLLLAGIALGGVASLGAGGSFVLAGARVLRVDSAAVSAWGWLSRRRPL